MTKRWTAAVLAIPLLLGVAACGDDDEDGDAPAASAEASEGSDDQAVCDAYIDVLAEFNAEPSEETTPPKIDALEASKPEEIDAALQTMIDALRTAVETDDDEGLESEEFEEASSAVDEHLWSTCDADEKLEVDAVDYAFTGLPDELDAGRVFFRLTNATTHGEAHEIGIARKNDGVTESWDELLADVEGAEDKVEFKGGAFTPEEGATSVVFTDLQPGEYIALCFIPVGGADDGAPHFTKGMRHEFTVS